MRLLSAVLWVESKENHIMAIMTVMYFIIVFGAVTLIPSFTAWANRNAGIFAILVLFVGPFLLAWLTS